MTSTPATVLASETHLMESRHAGRTYRITVSLPPGYAAAPGADWPFNDMPAKWPVVYVLDGNWYFGLVTDTIRPMSWCGSTTDAVVVGICYPENDDPMEAVRVQFTRRDHDLTPVREEAVEQSMGETFKRPVPNGDAGNFHRFIKEELIPFIEQTYRADPAQRILVGHSYGGLFALFGLFETPDLFQKLIIGSPSLSYGNRWMFAREEAFAQTHPTLPASVYLFAADLEESLDDTTLTDTLRFGVILQSRNYEGFSLVRRVFRDLNHCEVAVPGIHAGLKLALKKGSA